ncbi:DUF4268 domain-containing protein [Streptacidiphilus sp. N1-3]|uniref:DUF4268 domain-containing protein n=1 Tax=Streptacidiphilus alkalitolerans TaxID=3342712 RepID=A0ABV6X8Z5_9ACTN
MTDLPATGSTALGRLLPVPLREVWAHEALDFTPWLLANPEVLGEALDMDLEIDSAEHPVGDFSLDLIGTDLRTGRSVVIENQLEATDHSHLGQLLTYAGGTDAANIVWVAKAFREEHRAALDWLNSRTDTETCFFGVEVSAVRIGSSAAAPLLRVVAQPNDWGKTVRAAAQAREGGSSDKAMLYGQFWDRYLTELSGAGLHWTKARKSPKQNWFEMPSGVSGTAFTISFARGRLRSELYLGHSNREVNTTRYQHLLQARDALETSFGADLTFEPLEGKLSCRIADYFEGASIEATNEWDSYLTWFINTQRRLRAALKEIGGIPTAQ